MTCTTTYEANHHYFGNTKWCTASDRLGRYDGWEYYLRYIFNNDDITDDDYYDDLLNVEIKALLVQYTDKETKWRMQIQYLASGEYGQVCDQDDNEMVASKAENMIPENARKILYESKNKLLEAQKTAFASEYHYQKKKDPYVKQKRAELTRRMREMISRLSTQVITQLTKKRDFVEQKFGEMMKSNLITNKDFLMQLVNNTDKFKDFDAKIRQKKYEENNNPNDSAETERMANEYEQLAKSQSYCIIEKAYAFSNSKVLMIISPIYGISDDVWMNRQTGMPYLAKVFYSRPEVNGTQIKGYGYVIASVDTQVHTGNFTTIDLDSIKRAGIQNIIAHSYLDNSTMNLPSVSNPCDWDVSPTCESYTYKQEETNRYRLIKLSHDFMLFDCKTGCLSKFTIAMWDNRLILSVSYDKSLLMGFGYYDDITMCEFNKEGLEMTNQYKALYVTSCGLKTNYIVGVSINDGMLYLFSDSIKNLGIKPTNNLVHINPTVFDKRYMVFLPFAEESHYVYDNEQNILYKNRTIKESDGYLIFEDDNGNTISFRGGHAQLPRQ